MYLYRIGTEQCTINFPGGPSSPLRLIGHRWAMYAHTRPPTQSNSPMIIIWSDINQILVKFESKISFIFIRTNHKLILGHFQRTLDKFPPFEKQLVGFFDHPNNRRLIKNHFMVQFGYIKNSTRPEMQYVKIATRVK